MSLLNQAEHIFDINSQLRGSINLLMTACVSAYPNMVEYLLDKGAEVNLDIESQTPLIYACKSIEPTDRVVLVVEKLLAAGAVVNISNTYGDTPLIFACQNGHTRVVELLVTQASLDATNNQTGNSAIFYAIEKNCLDIVKILLENGASINIPNRRGYLPRSVAETHGFEDILKIFPKTEEKYIIPSHYLDYTHYRHMVPGILGPTDAPAYFNHIEPMLIGMEAQLLHENFAKAKVSLPELLSMTRKKLADIGVDLPFMQKKIMQGLFNFHRHPWNRKCIPASKMSRFDTFELYAMLAGDLQQFVVIRSGLIFLLNFDHDHNWPYPTNKHLGQILLLLELFHDQLTSLHNFVEGIKKNNLTERVDEITASKVDKFKKKKSRLHNVVINYSLAITVVCFIGFVIKRKMF